MSPQQRGPPARPRPRQSRFLHTYLSGRSPAEPEPCPSYLSCIPPMGSPLPWLSSSFCWRSLSEAPLSSGKSLPGQWVGVAGLPAPTQPHPELTNWGGCGKAGRESVWLSIPASQEGALLGCLLGAPDATSCHQQKETGSGTLFWCTFSFCAEQI